MIAAPEVEIVIDATGSPAAGIRHVLACCRHGKHVVMVNVEADALAGPLLARKAREAGIVYSLAYGDQPALICEMVDWARCIGLEVIAAGKGTKYLPAYHGSTPDTVWEHYGITAARRARRRHEPADVQFVPGRHQVGARDGRGRQRHRPRLPRRRPRRSRPAASTTCRALLKPRADGGMLDHRGQVEVISSLERDGRPVFRDLRWGVYVTFAARHRLRAALLRRVRAATPMPSGEYAAMYKPYHLIGLELGVTRRVGRPARANRPARALAWHGDVVATAKRDLKAGETLDGEGGFCVYGKLMPASRSIAAGGLPLGLAHGIRHEEGGGRGNAAVAGRTSTPAAATTRWPFAGRWSASSGAAADAATSAGSPAAGADGALRTPGAEIPRCTTVRARLQTARTADQAVSAELFGLPGSGRPSMVNSKTAEGAARVQVVHVRRRRGSATRRARVRSRPRPASATVAATLAFFG